jgi:hypothetical protein
VIPLKLETAGVVTEVLARAGDWVKKPGDHQARSAALRHRGSRGRGIAPAGELRLLDNTLPDSLVSGKAVTGERLRNAEVRSGVEAARARLDRAKYERSARSSRRRSTARWTTCASHPASD